MEPKCISENFDLKSALARFAQDYELLDEAIAIFKEEALKHLGGIKKSLERGELKEASNYAHTLKGECGAVGAMKAQSVSWTMEKAAGNGDNSAAREILPELENEITKAIEYLPESTATMAK
ncbi:Hpt domain-containing protein [Desulfovibrio sp. JC010]|uniref:Hpt domain-containing protein n=1 Tax=Desulfovibrio sp. JC010 TaxID=2593641 RepID=UPI0013D59861|nr:Hpt domain-containing protein [Desulfovibrio sp. JC010]NDV28382.1 Hpt domain-containing protein [Desulfovibrio sp. JC010]